MKRDLKPLHLITSARHELLMYIPVLLIAGMFLFLAVPPFARAVAPVVGPWVDYLYSLVF